MKEKIKQIILYFMIFYTIIISLIMIFNISTSTKYIEFSDSEDNLIKINELAKELSNIKQNDCTDSINNLIDTYKGESYNGYISLKDYYEQDNNNYFSLYFQETKEICQITDNEYHQYNFPYALITKMIIREEIFQKYMYQYELSFKDIITGSIHQPYLTSIEYSIIKQSELTIISNLIELIKERTKTNE